MKRIWDEIEKRLRNQSLQLQWERWQQTVVRVAEKVPFYTERFTVPHAPTLRRQGRQRQRPTGLGRRINHYHQNHNGKRTVKPIETRGSLIGHLLTRRVLIGRADHDMAFCAWI